MLRQLFVHQWRSYVRSPFLSQSIVQSVFLGIFALYMILSFFGLGYVLKDILEEALPEMGVLSAFSRLTFYYFIFDLIIRFFFQAISVPWGSKPYLILPIRKNSIGEIFTGSVAFQLFQCLAFLLHHTLLVSSCISLRDS